MAQKAAKHAQFSPSSASRFIRCPGSVLLCEGADERSAEIWTAEGSVAHQIRELCLLLDMDPSDFVGKKLVSDGFTVEVDDAMADALRPGIEWLREQAGELYIEQRVSSDRWMPGQFGTLDAGIISKNLIIVNDLKFGAGMAVSVADNEQLMIYALFFWDQIARHVTDATEFLLVVDQPRARKTAYDDGTEAPEGWGGEWRVSLDELLEFGERLKTQFDIAVSDDAWLRAGPVQCRMCPAKGFCDEYARYSLALLDLELGLLDPDVTTLRNVGEFSPAQRVKIAMNQDIVTGWMKAVYAQVLRDAQHERETPGVKAVQSDGSGPRKWKDEEAAARFMRKALGHGKIRAPGKLFSPKQLEDHKEFPKAKREEIADLVTRNPGKPTLVWGGDNRPAITIAGEFDDDIADEFDDDDDDNPDVGDLLG